MSRYIDADALLDLWSERKKPNYHENLGAYYQHMVLRNLINEQPTVDAVPVTRCAQCKWWWKVNGLCTHPKHCHDNVCVHECGKDYFCADGERKDGEHEQ